LDGVFSDGGLNGWHLLAIARKSAWQFLNKTTDPRISMLRKFAKAMGISPGRLVGP
jgi:hypothetical protein